MRIATDRIVAETLQLSDKELKLQLIWAKPISSQLKSFLYNSFD
jgi:hypothetical protein